MAEMFLDDLEREIALVKGEVDKDILRRRQYREKLYRRKPRDEEERKILTLIAKNKWEKAEREGKITYLSPTEWGEARGRFLLVHSLVVIAASK
ncbi:MAG: hypothetical protein GXX09_12600 [Syntrophomonadaceae bacterium]|nr:hypothetical protein [Syntrophomonadaceae bacterium]